MMKLKCFRFAVYVVALMSFLNTYGQDLPGIILPSPQTRELNKYVDFPTDYSSGIPNISIPLYVIKMRGIQIPITLNYHASGIKYAQEDGNVGVGWSLSCDYRVSRTIYGQPDASDIEMNPSLYQSKMQYFANNIVFPAVSGSVTVADRELLYPQRDRDKFLKRLLPMKYQTDPSLPSQTDPLLDGEYDLFNYNMPGAGGKFIITDRLNKIVQEINPGRNKFGYLEGIASNNYASGIIGFRIKDDNQNIFSYGEQVDKSGIRVLETNNGPNNAKDITAWALTDVDTKYGEKIKFRYENKNISSKFKKQVSIDIKDPTGDMNSFWSHSIDNEAKRSDYSVFALASIGTENEYVTFITQNNTGATDRISRIDIVDSSTNSLIKRIEFTYQSIYFNLHSFTFLQSLRILGKDLAEVERYQFDYYDADDYPSGYIGMNNIVPDQWGYNKVASNQNELLHNEFGNDHARPDGAPATTNRISGKLSDYYQGYLGNRNEFSSPEVFSLQSIKYPTGGTTVYEYEPNRNSDISPRYLGGIRIKSVKQYGATYDMNGNPTLDQRRDYTYQGGYNRAAFFYDEFRKEYPIFEYASGWYSRRGVTYSTNSLGDRLEMDNTVHYSGVTEHFLLSTGNRGKVVYQYSNISGSLGYLPFNIQIEDPNGYMQYYLGGPTYTFSYSLWKQPALLSKLIYSNTGALVKKESYLNSTFGYQSFTGLKVKPYVKILGSFDAYFPLYYAHVSSLFNHGLYTVETGNTLPIQKTETVYSSADSLVTVTNYEYNSLNQVNKETATDSKNSVIERRFIYPADIPYDNTALQMIAANDVNKILEESVRENNVLISKVESQYYKLFDEIFVSAKTRRLNTVSQALEDAVLFKRYDNQGNITSVAKANDVTVNYIWSYRNRFPVAEIRGVSYEALQGVLGAGAIAAFGLNSSPTLTDINNFLAPVRTAIQNGTLPLAKMLSFSYDPYVGIKTQTDVRGVVLYYDYDSFNRLSSIKDEQGHLLKKNEYHYNSQN